MLHVQLVYKAFWNVTSVGLCLYQALECFVKWQQYPQFAIDKIYFQCFRSLCTPLSHNQRNTALVQMVQLNEVFPPAATSLQREVTWLPTTPTHRPHEHPHLTILYLILQIWWKCKAAKTWHLCTFNLLILQGIFKIQVLLKSKNEKKNRRKKKYIKHVKTRVECLRNGSSAFCYITCWMTEGRQKMSFTVTSPCVSTNTIWHP